jgi:threonine dehydrogenase-like Zn-dependent dehydrogenase
MKIRGIVFKGNREAELKEFEISAIGRGQVLIKTIMSTICGSDLHFYRAPPEELGLRRNLIAGHEAVGIIYDISGDENEFLRKGDRVIAFHRTGCFKCKMCKKGWPQYCENGMSSTLVLGQLFKPWRSSGTFADYFLAPIEVIFKVPNEIDNETASILSCNGITAYQIIRDLGVNDSSSVAITGLGPLGLVAATFLREITDNIIGIEINENRLKLAEKIGINKLIRYHSNINIENEIRRLNDGSLVDIGIDFSGSAEAIRTLIKIVRGRGKIGLIGIGGSLHNATLDILSIIDKSLQLQGVLVGNMYNMYDLIDFVIKHKISLKPIVTHKFSLEEYKEAFKIADSGNYGKVAFIF